MAESSKHPSKTRLIEFLNEDLDQGQDRTVGSHIEQCEACQSTIEEIISSTFVAVLPSDASASDQDKAIRQPGKRSFDDLPQFAENSRFLVLDELARGGMGIVYRGFDRVLKREVAIKVSKGDGREAGSIRFHREAEISGQLQHPGIIPVYEVGQLQDERYYIAMKLVEGQTLLASIGSDREKFTKHLNIFDSVCRTMAYAHSKNVIHRDLKPDNVMVGSFGEVQVMDWGLGRKLNSHSQTDESSLGHDVLQDDLLPGSTRVGDVIGTPAYIAPEQARGDQADKRADVFAMGGILYQILTGKPPFDAPTAAAAMQQSRSHDFNSAMKRLDQSGADDSLVGLVKSCLAADPSDRPVDAEHVSQTFSQYLKRRKQQDENDRLDKARIAERQIAEQQRNLQLRLSLAVVVTMLLSTVAAGYMYMSEKSARIENQANVDRDAAKRVIENEEQIRSSIVNAKKYQSQAIAKAPHEQSDGWTLALKEIERSAPFATDAIDGALRTEFNQYEEVVRTETAAALRRSADHAVEGKCCERLFELSEHSYFPLDLRLCDWKDLTLQFASTFERVGIKTNEISRETVERIAASIFKPELIHGLMMWRHELDFQASYGVNNPSDLDKIKQTKLWLSWLIEQVDPDPFRSQVRRLAVDADARSVLSLSEQEEAIASLLTIHTFALAFHSADVAAEDRVDYLLRSHQRYPKDFFVNWYLPNSGVDIRSQRGFVVACYSLRPNNPAVLSSLAQGFIRNNQPLRAAESLETLVRTAPRYLLGHRSLVEAYEMAGETAKADKQWKIAEQAFADVQLSFSNRIAHYQKSNQLDHAAALKTLLTENAQRPDVSPSDKGAGQEPLSENVVAEQQKLEIEIKKAYESVLAEPKSGPRYGRLERAYRKLCTLLKNTDRPDLLNKVLDEAISQFNDAAEKAQDVSTPHVLLYKLCEKFERRETAISSLEQAIKLNPKRDAYYWWLVNLHDELIERYRHDLQPQLAERTIDQGVKLLEALALAAPSDVAAAHESMARFCDKYRRFGSSIRAWKRAMKVSPDHVSYWKKLAEANFRLGKVRHFEGRVDEAQTALDLAIQGYRQWVSNGTQSSTPHEILSEACEYRGLLAESITQLKIAIQIHPKYQPHLHRFAYLCTTHASQLKENDDTDAGVAFLLEAMDFLKQIEPEHAGLIEVYEKLSELHASNGDYDKAIEAIGVVIKSRPNDEFTLEKLDRYRTAAEQFDGKQQNHSSNPSQ